MVENNNISYIPYKMWDNINNFGDAINPNIIKKIAKIEPVAVKSGGHLLAIGSVLQKANVDSVIWGTGLLNQDVEIRELSGENVFAVRGHRTRNELIRRGIVESDQALVLGDPGFLVGTYWPLVKQVSKKSGEKLVVGVIPHHSQFENKAFQDIHACDYDVKLIDMRTNDLSTLDDIKGCDIIISESLHGLIFAESYGIKNAWISRTEDTLWKFKFEDWYSTCGSPPQGPVLYDVNESFVIANAVNRASLHDCTIDINALIGCFPQRLVSRNDLVVKVGFEASRKHKAVVIISDAVEMLREQYPTASDETRNLIEAAFRAAYRKKFRGWAESRYSIVVSDQMADITAELPNLVQFMDRRPSLKNIFIEHANSSDTEVLTDPDSGLRYRIGSKTGKDGIVIRANGIVDLRGNRFVTVLLA